MLRYVKIKLNKYKIYQRRSKRLRKVIFVIDFIDVV